jgi:hypothetical protein
MNGLHIVTLILGGVLHYIATRPARAADERRTRRLRRRVWDLTAENTTLAQKLTEAQRRVAGARNPRDVVVPLRPRVV